MPKERGPRGPKAFEPTPKEIERACQQLQQGWSEIKRIMRAYGFTHEQAVQLMQWKAPLVRIRELGRIESTSDEGCGAETEE